MRSADRSDINRLLKSISDGGSAEDAASALSQSRMGAPNAVLAHFAAAVGEGGECGEVKGSEGMFCDPSGVAFETIAAMFAALEKRNGWVGLEA